jgi:hypothetical protein
VKRREAAPGGAVRSVEREKKSLISSILRRQGRGQGIGPLRNHVWDTPEVARRYRPKLVIAFAGAAERRRDNGRKRRDRDAATIVGVHNHGWAHFTERAEDLAAAFSALRITERLGKLEAGKPARFAV